MFCKRINNFFCDQVWCWFYGIGYVFERRFYRTATLWLEISAFLLRYLFFYQRNLIRNSIKNPYKVLSIYLKIVTRAITETRHLGAAKRARTIRAQQKGRREKGHRAKRAQNKKGARSRCCVTVTFKVVISSDNRVLSQSFFFFFFFCRNIIPSLRLHCLKYVSIKSLKTEESYNTKL